MGSVVEVPFKNRTTHAFVLDVLDKSPVPSHKLKDIGEVIVSEPLFDAQMLKFLRWISEYYCHPLGEVLATALPKACWVPRRKKVEKKPKKVEELPAPVAGPILNPEQQAMLDKILESGEHRPYLLHGVTGSGKTEVYIRVLEKILAEGKGGIILAPEIALTPQLLGRFSARFPGQVAVLHSDLTDKERFEQWERIRNKQARIVVGARSAIFAPVPDLGLIVVDEEHEASFKQEDSVRYHARDIAVVRAGMCGAKILLGSATPSLESYAHAKSGKYVYLQLTKRISDRPLPKIHFVDMKDSAQWMAPQTPWLSRLLCQRIDACLKSGQQALLYLNRLGFAHFLFCKDCGHTWHCKACDVSLTYYKNPPALKCHYCGMIRKPPSQCENCHGTNMGSMGLGTEQLENELKKVFPSARIGRMDRSQIKNRKDLESILNQITAREIDIVIGTQMITKGHDFPGIALVGIVMADASLNIPDFRSQERTFQIITQVSGRAGRAENPGEVVLQTIQPEHPVFHYAAENRSVEFYRTELEARKSFAFPPFQRTALLRFQHRNAGKVEMFAGEVCQFMRREGVTLKTQVVGPSEAPLAKLKHLYRWHCLVKSPSVSAMQALLKRVDEFVASKKSAVQYAADIDPLHMM
jgi:primosomal protein N' (replication factor Y) (superfamily II helicase)